VLSARDVAWVSFACLPAFVYAVVHKAQRIASRELSLSPLDGLSLWASDAAVFVMWLALAFAVRAAAQSRRGRASWGGLLQLLLALYVAAVLGAQGYFMSTGASLDFTTLAFALQHLEDSRKVIASASSPARWAAFALTLAGVLALPWLGSRFFSAREPARPSTRALGALLSLSVAGMALAFAMGQSFRGSVDLARDPLAQLLATIGEASDEDNDPAILARAQSYPRGPTSLTKRGDGGKKNVVVVLLESTSAWSTSLYGGEHDTTPFMRELAQRGVVGERAYAVVPHTSKAVVASLCGVDPRPGVEMVEALENGIPGKCIASLLEEQGYRTAMLQAATSEFENRPQLVQNMGFREFIPGEQMNGAGLKKANYFGYEDRILLEPTRKWLQKHAKKGPFFLAYLTNTPHHDYLAPRSYGWQEFTKSRVKNRYLNTVRYDDALLRDLFAEFKRAGVLENTVFVIVGDHGDAFGEHGLSVHDDIMYDECLRVPLLVVDPGRTEVPVRLPGPFSQLDIAPTVLDMLGFDFDDGAFVGRSMFAPSEKRALYFACLTDRKCLARVEGGKKLIHSFGRKPDEYYDLGKDPGEKTNLAKRESRAVEKAREDAIAWYRTVRAVYRPALEAADSEYITDKPPKIDHPRRIRFGDSVEYLGWSVSEEPVVPGSWVNITYYFHVLEPMPSGSKLFVYAEDADKAYRWNHVPVHRMHPESRWRSGQYLADPQRVKIPTHWQRERVIVRGGFEKGRTRLLSTPKAPESAPVLAEIPIVGRGEGQKQGTAPSKSGLGHGKKAVNSP
jgi:lipoteichoic acid synthase